MFQYTGRENDDTGSYHYRARYYDPNVGRFTQEDPAGELGGLNLYAYAASNPLRFTDPTGLAYFAKRPLQHGGRVVFMCNPVDNYFNTEPVHENLFFEDGKKPSNLGFFPDGVHEDSTRGPWRCKSGHYDDCLMRKAVENVGTPKPYCLLGPGQFNCQDWAEAVRKEYARLDGSK